MHVRKAKRHMGEDMPGIPLRTHLVGTKEATAKGSQDLNDSGAAVAPDWVERPDFTHASSPASVLRQYHPQVGHKEGVLLRLGETKTKIYLTAFSRVPFPGPPAHSMCFDIKQTTQGHNLVHFKTISLEEENNVSTDNRIKT